MSIIRIWGLLKFRSSMKILVLPFMHRETLSMLPLSEMSSTPGHSIYPQCTGRRCFTNAQSSCTLSVPVQHKYIILFIDFNLHTCPLFMKKILFSTWEVFILSPGCFICCTGSVEAMVAKYIMCLDHSSEVWAWFLGRMTQ